MSIKVYPNYSPRLVIVNEPETEASIQVLHDGMKDWEDEPANLSYPFLVKTTGGQYLGPGVTVGLTMELQNALVGFEQRHTILETGTVTTLNTDGVSLIDSAATFDANGVEPGDWVINFTDQSWCTVLAVVSETELLCFPLGAGSNNQFNSSDVYKVLDLVQCEAAGGNLTALDSAGDPVSPLFPTALVNLVRTSASSATQSQLEALRYASYQNAVWLQPSSSITGTDYPSGTRQYPVNNLVDATAICRLFGFSTVQVLESMTLDSGTDISGFEIIGKSHVLTELVMDTSALCEDVTITNCNISGVLDGGTHIQDCMVGNLTYVNGHIHSSGLYGVLYLDGAEDAVLVDCYTTDQDSPPVIDMGGTGQNLAMPNYSGLITIR